MPWFHNSWFSKRLFICILVLGAPLAWATSVEVFKSPRPLDVYEQTLKNFLWSTQSDLIIHQGTDVHQRSGFSYLVWHQDGNFLLQRKLFSQEQATEVLRLNLQSSLKLAHAQEASPVAFIPEFLQWANLTFSEVFSLFDEMGLTELPRGRAQQVKGLSCWTVSGENELCLEPDHKLPMNGKLVVDVSSNTRLSISFTSRLISPEEALAEITKAAKK